MPLLLFGTLENRPLGLARAVASFFAFLVDFTGDSASPCCESKSYWLDPSSDGDAGVGGGFCARFRLDGMALWVCGVCGGSCGVVVGGVLALMAAGQRDLYTRWERGRGC